MSENLSALKELFGRIPRRHTSDNVKEFYGIIDEYEDILKKIEAESADWEKAIAPYFDTIDPVRANIKKSSDNKASKKMKDSFFDEASGTLKDSIETLMGIYQ